MDLLEVVDRVRELLQRRRRLTYRMLKAQFQLDDESLVADRCSGCCRLGRVHWFYPGTQP